MGDKKECFIEEVALDLGLELNYRERHGGRKVWNIIRDH
jgi:hypothetical protein